MKRLFCRIAATLALVAVLTGGAVARKIVYGGPGDITKTRSLLDAIEQSKSDGRTLHIIFVHGIRAKASGGSAVFAKRLAKSLGGTLAAPPLKIGLDIGPWQAGASYLVGTGEPERDRAKVWRSEVDWEQSRPFVERSVITSTSGNVTIDELNYWPLLFPLKCRFLLEPEHDLSGNDVENLGLCEYWVGNARVKELLASKPKSGGGARLNAYMKQQIMNWGLADAVIALGPMRMLLNRTVEKAFQAATENGASENDFVVISESLGSFIILDAYAARGPNSVKVLNNTADLYFMANQFALLELARIEGLKPPLEQGSGIARAAVAETPASPLRALLDWAGAARTATADGRPARAKQIVAFSDPSDLLTYRVPELGPVTVVNIYDRNQSSFLGLVANPLSAHTGHLENPDVWRVLMRRSGEDNGR